MSPRANRSDVILLVDNDRAVMAIIPAILIANGYDVITVPDRSSALRMIEESPEDIGLVITEITMPDMDGLALSVRLKYARPSLPILLVSDFVSRGDQDTQAGRIHFLLKPFTSQALLVSVRSILSANRGSSPKTSDTAVA